MAIPGIIVYGTSSPLPADLAASNTFTGTNTFSAVTTTNGRRQKITVTAINYTALTTDEIIVCTASVTITLPVASGSGQVYTIVNESVSGTVTVDGNGSDTIKKELTQTLAEGEDLIVRDYIANKWC